MNLNDYIKFDDSRKQFEIITGTQGKYSYDAVSYTHLTLPTNSLV